MNKVFSHAVAVLATACLVTACSAGGSSLHSNSEEFGYQVQGPLTTVNAGSAEGHSTLSQELSGRLYPGVYVPGPNGQMIPNADLVKTQVLPGDRRQVVYTISDAAVFSDATPVTCNDFLLTFTAGKLPELFGSWMPLFDDADTLTCAPGSKTFTLTMKEDRGARWRDLFEPGTVLPSHAVAARVGMAPDEMVGALVAQNPVQLRSIAEVWQHGFDLSEYDPELQVSFGPYKIETVGQDGEVVLAANDSYYGDAPALKKIVVWPGTADSGELVKSGGLRIGNLAEPAPSWYDVNAENEPVDVTNVVGELTDALVMAQSGPWADPKLRRALAHCVNPPEVALTSAKMSGLEVDDVPVQVVAHGDPLASKIQNIGDAATAYDIEKARVAAGTVLRISTPIRSARMSAMIQTIHAQCQPAGIDVVDQSDDLATLADLPGYAFNEEGQVVEKAGTIDALLMPIDAQVEYPAANNRVQDLDALRSQEKWLWNEIPILPLAAQPRAFAIDQRVDNVVAYTGLSGIGWNMDRWTIDD